MDSMLQQLAYYKRHDPAVAEEVASISFSINHSHFLSQVELMENLFDCLCSLMLEVTNRERFLKGEQGGFTKPAHFQVAPFFIIFY